MTDKPQISIVSVTYRSYEDTRDFVESVYRNTFTPYEFIIGVNGRVEDKLAEYLIEQERLGKVKLVWNPTNVGVRAFNQVMRLASTDFVFRCDSDIIIGEPYWDQRMVDQLKTSGKEIGQVVAVGTSNTKGFQIPRTASTTEVDMIMSNCMLIDRLQAQTITHCLRGRLPAMREYVTSRLEGSENYIGELEDLKATLEYAAYHAPWWDLQFGGPSESRGYGSDDMWWSIMARWAGLKLVTSRARVFHKDASARPGYEAERHRLVARGFQFMRTSLSLIMDCWDTDKWMELPNRLPPLVEFRNSTKATSV